MKKLLFIILLFASCQQLPQKNESTKQSAANSFIADSIVRKIIEAKYTAQNELDGTEFATVEKLIILHVDTLATANELSVKYSIKCSYQPAALPPGYEKGAPPPLDETAVVILVKENKKWKIK